MRVLYLLVLLIHFSVYGQKKPLTAFDIERPKLIVGIVIDQMRWDYLYRYYDRYLTNGAFKRLLNQGFSCENTFIPYTPSATACGHACVYTGSVPAVNGIAGNYWWDAINNKSMYCVEDKSVQTVGSSTEEGKMSPKNLATNTITDELRLATNFRSKVIAISIKDRSSILPAGHSANAAYWYDDMTGDFISSTHYMKGLPQWVQDFNKQKLVDKYYDQEWRTLYPLSSYKESTGDTMRYERLPFGADQTGFPYNFKKLKGTGKGYYVFPSLPAGNNFTLDMAKGALENEQLGQTGNTDFLAVSFSSPDYIGHAFGPNSIEAEDTYLRLDKDLGAFFDHLDKVIGKGNYLLFLTADHGVAHVPGLLTDYKMPGGSLEESKIIGELNAQFKNQYNAAPLIVNASYYNLTLNHRLLDSLQLDKNTVKKNIINELEKIPGIYRAIDKQNIAQTSLPKEIKERIVNGYFPNRSGDIQIVPSPNWFHNNPTGTDHSVWNPYDTHIPLLWYGWKIKQGKMNRETYMSDIAPTLAALLHIQMPNGCVGKVITEVVNNK